MSSTSSSLCTVTIRISLRFWYDVAANDDEISAWVHVLNSTVITAFIILS